VRWFFDDWWEATWRRKYVKVEEVWKSVWSFKDGEAVIELGKEIALNLLEGSVLRVENFVKFL
jgi:hypothetical protein